MNNNPESSQDAVSPALHNDSRFQTLNAAAIANINDSFLHGQPVACLRVGCAARRVLLIGQTRPEERLLQEGCGALWKGSEGSVSPLKVPGAAANSLPRIIRPVDLVRRCAIQYLRAAKKTIYIRGHGPRRDERLSNGRFWATCTRSGRRTVFAPNSTASYPSLCAVSNKSLCVFASKYSNIDRCKCRKHAQRRALSDWRYIYGNYLSSAE